MIEKIQADKATIQEEEAALINEAIRDHPVRNKQRLIDILTSFVQGGKHVRGGLFTTAVSWWQDVKQQDFRVAACIELLHSAMLIQDDIMDDDAIRRGNKSLHTQFQTAHDDRRVSEGMAVCSSDLLIFTAFKALSEVNGELVASIGEDLTHVALGQLRDITHDDPWNDGVEPDVQDIINLHTNKTGRYTFTLPLALAQIRADVSSQDLKQLGDALGVIYQLRDDELNIYGTQEETGKPTMSDVEENKHTVLRRLLLDRHSEAHTYFGSSLSPSEKDDLKALFEDIKEDHEAIKQRFVDEAKDTIEASTIPVEGKQDLQSLTRFVASRQR